MITNTEEKNEYDLNDFIGFIMMNTEYIPTFNDYYDEKTKIIYKFPVPIDIEEYAKTNERIYLMGKIIECLEDIPIYFDNYSPILKKGKHYFYEGLFTFCSPRILLKKININNIKVYDTYNKLTQNYVKPVEINIYYQTLSYPVINKSLYSKKYCDVCDYDYNKICDKCEFEYGLSYSGIFDLVDLNNKKWCNVFTEKMKKTNFDILKNNLVLSDNIYSAFLYSDEVKQIQKDQEVTQYLKYYDKNIRLSKTPCILIQFDVKDYDTLSEILDEKYYAEIKGIKHCYNSVEKEQEIYDLEIKNKYINLSNFIKKGEELGIFTFVKTSIVT